MSALRVKRFYEPISDEDGTRVPVPGEKRPASHRPAQIYRLKAGAATIFFEDDLTEP